MDERGEPYDEKLARMFTELAREVRWQHDLAETLGPSITERGGIARRTRRPAIVAVLTTVVLVAGLGAVAGAAGLFGPGFPRLELGEAPPTARPSIGQPDVARAPQSGWVFVVDEPDVAELSDVLLVNPNTGEVEARYPAGYDPEIALSPMADRLYVASSLDGRSSLAAFDTASGAVVYTVEMPDRFMHTLPPTQQSLALSDDGRWLFAIRHVIIRPGIDSYAVAALDTVRRAWLPEVTLSGCTVPFLSARPSGALVTCDTSGMVMNIDVQDGLLVTAARTDVGTTILDVVSHQGGVLALLESGEVTNGDALRLTLADDDDARPWPGSLAVVDGAVVAGFSDSGEGIDTIRLAPLDGDPGQAVRLERRLWDLATTAGGRILGVGRLGVVVFDSSLNEIATWPVGDFIVQPVVVQ